MKQASHTEQDRVRRLFRFLHDLNQLSNPPVRRLDKQQWVFRLAELPEHSAVQTGSLLTALLGRQSQSHGDPTPDEFIFRVRRPSLTPPPTPPEPLHSWLEPTWNDFPGRIQIRPPRLREAPNGPREERFEDDQQRVEMLRRWEAEREDWLESERPARAAAALFEKLYELYQRIEREGERLEVVVGDGLLVWDRAASSRCGSTCPSCLVEDGVPARARAEDLIEHPLLLQRVELEFRPEEPAFLVREGDRPPEFYDALLRGIPNVDAVLRWAQDRIERAAKPEDTALHPLDTGNTTRFLREFVHRLSAQGKLIEEGRQFEPGPDPQVVRDPVLFVRARTSGFTHMLERVLEDIEARQQFSPALLSIVGIHESPASPAVGVASPDSIPTALPTAIHHDERILFSKPANEEQLRIARRLQQYGCVLVQGPPGTGKTHTIANLIGHLLAEGKSILVTSHTDKALRVVREHVVEQLRPLCVSVLTSEADSRELLKQSVNAIVDRLSRDDEEQLRAQAATLSEQRAAILKTLHDLDQRLLEARSAEYRPIVIAGKAYRPAEAARRVVEDCKRDGWIPGPIATGAPLPLSVNEVNRLYWLNAETSAEAESEVATWLPDVSALPAPEAFEELVTRLHEVEARALSADPQLWSNSARPVRPEELGDLLHRCFQAVEQVMKAPDWELAAIDAGRRGGVDRQLWDGLIEKIQNVQQQVAKGRKARLEYGLELSTALPLEDQRRLLGEIIRHLERWGQLNWLVLNVLHRPWKQFIAALRVTSKEPQQLEEFRALAAWADALSARRELVHRWECQVTALGGPTPDQLGPEPEEVCAQYLPAIQRALDWYQKCWTPVEQSLRECGLRWEQLLERIPPQSASWGLLLRLRQAVHEHLPAILNAQADYLRLRELQQQQRQLLEVLTAPDGVQATRVVSDLRDAAKSRDIERYRSAYERLRFLDQQRKLLAERKALLERLERDAPDWAEAVRLRGAGHEGPAPPGDPERAWIWRQFFDELECRNAVSLTELERQRARQQQEFQRVTAELIECRAWAAQLRRVRGPQKQALEGWRLAVTKVGKGTGKYAAVYRAEAQRHMTQCRDAVPVWIMSLARVADNFDPCRTRFDVVIIDEASQSDVMGLLAVYLGHQVIIVGDDEQVSPDAVGLDQDQVHSLIETHLTGIPLAQLYDGQTSIYDLAKAAFGGAIMLREHFRCVPEIIQFSNHLCYNGYIKPLRDASKVTTKPHVVAHRVNGAATSRNINEEEAWQIAALVVAANEQPEYDGKTFGVISLVGDEQAARIDELLRRYLSPADHERRRLRCGNAAQFQGDERDIIWLSMVDSPKDGPLPLRTEGAHGMFKKRYNVAASRARDQLWVVYSLDHETDLKPGDIRRRLVEFALNPGGVTRESEALEASAESEFERQVIQRLVQARYRVIPQYPVGSYRIDIVVEGGGRRVAIECDGDAYHYSNEDQIRKDLERQAILERLGWEFIRIRGSLFFREPDRAMEAVFKRLQELGIPPEADTAREQAPSEEEPELLQRVIRRARELRLEWGSAAETAAGLLPGPARGDSLSMVSGLETWRPVDPPRAQRADPRPEPSELPAPSGSLDAGLPPTATVSNSSAGTPAPWSPNTWSPNTSRGPILRERVLDASLELLANDSLRWMNGREVVERLAESGLEVDEALVDSVLWLEGAGRVERDPANRRYRLTDCAEAPRGQELTEKELTGSQSETVVTRQWSDGGTVVVPACPGWQAVIRRDEDYRVFKVFIMYRSDPRPRRTVRTRPGTSWNEATQLACRLIVEMDGAQGWRSLDEPL